ncbi:MAG: hypothetical protein RMK99_00395 [Anaerolineales bacterium]|nr:hypothetical protein [Anaerolineales bacterium]
MPAQNQNDPIKTVTLAETDNYMIWTAEDSDGETTYNIELGNVTLHLFKEEWEEFVQLIRSVRKS